METGKRNQVLTGRDFVKTTAAVSGRGEGQQAKTDSIEEVLLSTVENSLNAGPWWWHALPYYRRRHGRWDWSERF